MNAISAAYRSKSIVTNDQHSHLNATRMLGRLRPECVADIRTALCSVRNEGQSISVAGGAHAMGGQQFAADSWLLDMRGMNHVLEFDRQRGLIKAEAGITWPELIRHYVVAQHGESKQWGISQKQTGADRLTLGGAVSANIHGRGLTMSPFVQDIQSLDVVLSDGRTVQCSRTVMPDLFCRVVGGYGLFGVVSAVTLRLSQRQKVQRVVELNRIDSIIDDFDLRIDAGYLYGDFQFVTAPEDPEFLARGVFSCYRPVSADTPIPDTQTRLSPANWRRLLLLAHRDKLRAFDEFAAFYLKSSEQIYWSDTHQLSLYLDDYHGDLDCAMNAQVPGSEVITELYVPRDRLAAFMSDVRMDFLKHEVDLIYGTVRLIEPDRETELAWATDRFACVIFNLHVDHCGAAVHNAADAFRRLIDIAISHNGSYFLTYHRHANRSQVLQCYPRFPSFLHDKLEFDPTETLQSDWYRHYRLMFS